MAPECSSKHVPVTNRNDLHNDAQQATAALVANNPTLVSSGSIDLRERIRLLQPERAYMNIPFSQRSTNMFIPDKLLKTHKSLVNHVHGGKYYRGMGDARTVDLVDRFNDLKDQASPSEWAMYCELSGSDKNMDAYDLLA